MFFSINEYFWKLSSYEHLGFWKNGRHLNIQVSQKWDATLPAHSQMEWKASIRCRKRWRIEWHPWIWSGKGKRGSSWAKPAWRPTFVPDHFEYLVFVLLLIITKSRTLLYLVLMHNYLASIILRTFGWLLYFISAIVAVGIPFPLATGWPPSSNGREVKILVVLRTLGRVWYQPACKGGVVSKLTVSSLHRRSAPASPSWQAWPAWKAWSVLVKLNASQVMQAHAPQKKTSHNIKSSFPLIQQCNLKVIVVTMSWSAHDTLKTSKRCQCSHLQPLYDAQILLFFFGDEESPPIPLL